MGIDCPKCKEGKLVFYDGGFEHDPKYVCNVCGYETDDPNEKLVKRIKKKLKI